MILRAPGNKTLSVSLDDIGLGTAINRTGTFLIKINLAHLPQPGHPRTDPFLLQQVLEYALERNAQCAIIEGADGFLLDNLKSIGLAEFVLRNRIRVLDLDNEPFERIEFSGQVHYLPRCLKYYRVRAAIPATSKRSGMTFSNNIKLFVGAVPRSMYQDGKSIAGRPRIHDDLHRSIATVYRAIMKYAPFDYYINGGAAVFETSTETALGEVLVGNDALELDNYILKKFSILPPEYIQQLNHSQTNFPE